MGNTSLHVRRTRRLRAIHRNVPVTQVIEAKLRIIVQKGQILTQHTGLPPRETGDAKKPFGGPKPKGKSKPKSRA